MRGTAAPSVRRPYIYPHRSTRALPRVSRRFAGGAAAAAVLSAALWYWTAPLLFIHNAIAFTLLDLAGVQGVEAIEIAVFSRAVPVLVTVPATSPWLVYGAPVATALPLILVAVYAPLARGLAAFLITILAASTVAYAAGAAALREPNTFPIVWMHTELLVWMGLPSMAALLFVTAQPSWFRGLCWMVAIEAFAVFWSAARFVAVLGVAQAFGPVLLPAIWFSWGLLADVLYITAFYSLVVHVNLRITPERRVTWTS